MKKLKSDIISGIYTITNPLSGKIYVGSSVDIYNRLEEHKKYLKYKKHHNYRLQKDYDEFGDIFMYEILEEQPVELMLFVETYWINTLNTTDQKCGYNYYAKWKGQGIPKFPVVALTVGGKYIGDFASCGEASRKLGVSVVGCNQCKKKYISKTSGIVFMDLEDYKENGFKENVPRIDLFKRGTPIITGLDYLPNMNFAKDFYEVVSKNSEFEEFYDLLSKNRKK